MSDQPSSPSVNRDTRRSTSAIIRALLPTRSGFTILLSLGLIIWGIAHWIFWILDHVPEGSDYDHQPPPTQEAPR